MSVELRHGSRWESFVTEDVSFGGMFVRSSAPPKELQLVRLRSRLPFSVGDFEANAVVTRRIEPASGPSRVAGMGLAFFALGGRERETWDRFMSEASMSCTALAEAPFSAHCVDERPPPGMGEGRVVRMELSALGDLFRLHARDGSRPGIFLATDPSGFSPTDRVLLHLVHPQSELWLPCVVRRVATIRARGIAVALSDDPPGRLRELHDALSRLIDQADGT